MTTERRPASLYGFLAGLISGLTICAVLALYLTHAPVPFVNKVQQATENVTPESVDPNRPLFSPQIPSAQPDAASASTAPAAPGSAQGPGAAAAPPAAAPPEPPPIAAAPTPGAATETSADAGTSRVMLQVGAFRSADDADAVRARLALLGLDGKVFAVTADGATLYRVRLGPYGQLDDLNGIRRTLSDNGMEAQVVHVR